MKQTSVLFFILLFLFASPVFAQNRPENAADSSPYSRFETGPAKSLDGILGTKKKLPPVTPEQIDEALAIYDDCKANQITSDFYDCDCMSSNFLEMRRGAPEVPADTLNESARKLCANKTFIAGTSYNNCVGWTKSSREDYKEYCTCYANTYAQNFGKAPTDSIRGRQVMMTNSLYSCRSGAAVARANNLEKVIDYLKKSGLYKTLFPGSNITPLPNASDIEKEQEQEEPTP